MIDIETLRSDKAIVAHRQCGSDGYAQERAAHLADAINAFGAERFAFTRRQP